jgi:excisionase family DNA binding protein
MTTPWTAEQRVTENSTRPHHRPCRTFQHPTTEVGELDLASRIAQRGSALSAQELAILLSCTASYLLKRAKAGKMPSYRIGGMVRFDPAITAGWLRARQVA